MRALTGYLPMQALPRQWAVHSSNTPPHTHASGSPDRKCRPGLKCHQWENTAGCWGLGQAWGFQTGSTMSHSFCLCFILFHSTEVLHFKVGVGRPLASSGPGTPTTGFSQRGCLSACVARGAGTWSFGEDTPGWGGRHLTHPGPWNGWRTTPPSSSLWYLRKQAA